MTWDSCIEQAARREGRVLLADAAGAVGDRGLQRALLPALRERIDVEVVRRGRKRPAPGTDLALFHVGNNPEAHGWIVDALRAPAVNPASSSCTTSSCTTSLRD